MASSNFSTDEEATTSGSKESKSFPSVLLLIHAYGLHGNTYYACSDVKGANEIVNLINPPVYEILKYNARAHAYQPLLFVPNPRQTHHVGSLTLKNKFITSDNDRRVYLFTDDGINSFTKKETYEEGLMVFSDSLNHCQHVMMLVYDHTDLLYHLHQPVSVKVRTADVARKTEMVPKGSPVLSKNQTNFVPDQVNGQMGLEVFREFISMEKKLKMLGKFSGHGRISTTLWVIKGHATRKIDFDIVLGVDTAFKVTTSIREVLSPEDLTPVFKLIEQLIREFQHKLHDSNTV